jgi:hypothetical protein
MHLYPPLRFLLSQRPEIVQAVMYPGSGQRYFIGSMLSLDGYCISGRYDIEVLGAFEIDDLVFV